MHDAKNTRGQAAVEALVYVSFFMFISVFIAIFFVLQQGQDLSQLRYQLGMQTAGQINDAISFAALAGPGFNGTFYIPNEILGRPYTVNLTTTGSIYITLPSSGLGSDTSYYYSLGRGNFYAYPLMTGAGEKMYQGSNIKAVWFDTSKGYMRIRTESDPQGGVRIYVG